MKLSQLLVYISSNLEFELWAFSSRIGIFEKEDKGLVDYLDDFIDSISVEDGRLIITIRKEDD